MKDIVVKASMAIAFLLLSSVIFSQKAMTLQECISYALENNLTLKRQELQTQISKNNYKQSYFNLLPDLGAGGSHNIGRGRVADYSSFAYSSNLNSGSVGLSSNLTIFSGFQNLNTIRADYYSFLSANESLKKARNDISLSIASSFFQILYDKEYFQVLKKQYEASKLELENTNAKYAVGSIARGAQLEVEATAMTNLSSLTEAQNRLNMSLLTLAQMLDLDTVKNFDIVAPPILAVPDTFAENADSVIDVALNTLPQIKGAEYALKSAERRYAVAKGAFSPQISLTGQYYSQYNLDEKTLTGEKVPVNDQLDQKLYKQLSINLSVPIFTRFQNVKNVKNAKLNKLDAEYSLQQSKLGVRKEVEQAFADAKASYESYKAQTKAAAAQEENFKNIRQKYELGLISHIDFVVAQNNYLKVQSDLLQAKYKFIFNLKILDFYKGIPIVL